MKLFLYIIYIVLAISFVNAATIMVDTFDGGSRYANITGNQTKEVTVGKGITILSANLSLSSYLDNIEGNMCYQETANVSTSCGGVSGGAYTDCISEGAWSTTYPCERVYDGDWSTYGSYGTLGHSAIQFHYVKPMESVRNGTYLMYKIGSDPILNVSIPQSCWDNSLNTSKVYFRFYSSPESYIYCYGAGVWVELDRVTTGLSWAIWEEAMWWKLTQNITNPKIFMNGTQVFNYTGNYNTTTTIWLNTTTINYYLANNATLPIKIQADTFTGSLNLYNLNITYTDFLQCSGTGTQSYNVTLYDEDNQTELFGKISVDLTVGDNTLTFDKSNISSIAICTTTNNTYIVSGTIFSETTDYLHKKYLVNVVMNNVTQYVKIYNSYNPSYSALSYYLKQYNYANYVGIIGRMQRYYPLNHTWLTVQEDRSDNFGRLVYDIKETNTEYRFLFYDSLDNLLDTTSTLKFVCVSGLCDVTSIISSDVVNTSSPIQSSATYNNATDIVTISWNDPTVQTSSVNVKVNQVSFTETVPICNYFSFSGTGSYNCNVTGYSGNVQVMVISNTSLATNQINFNQYFKIAGNETIGQILDEHDTSESSLFSFVIICVFVGIGLVSGSPIGVAVMVFAAVFFIGLLGLSTIVSLSFLGMVGVMALVVSLVIKRQ